MQEARSVKESVMREIVFRVWNGANYENNVMVGKFGAFYVNPMNGGLDANDSASLSPFNTKFSDNVVIEQFTGLTDKNGRRIFEGDICEYRTPEYMDGGHLVKSKWERGKVDISTAGVRFGGYQYSTPFGGVVTMYEVIGNIHDQKEDV